MASLILAMPGSGKTYAALKGYLQDVDYGYMRRSYGGLTDSGFVPELSGNYLRMLYLLSQHGVVASNCPELLDEYLLMGYDVTMVVPENPVRRYEELRMRKEGVPTEKGKYMSWYQEWLDLGTRSNVELFKGNVTDVIKSVRSVEGGIMPLARFIDADLIKEGLLWSIKTWDKFSNPTTGECRYCAVLPDGLLVIKTLKEGVWTYKVWFNSDLEKVSSFWNTKHVGTVSDLPDLL